MTDLQPTAGVLEIARRLEAAGYETWCVGGAVRDALLGGAPLDWDLATAARPEQVQALFGHKRTIPVGIEFGTVIVLDDDRVAHEVTTFRHDVTTDGRHAVVAFGASLEEDLARRDFTINAIAYRPGHGELRDPFGGRADLANRLVRAVGDASARMREDRLRALRGIRFAGRFDFAIEPSTLAAIRESAPHLRRLSAERVQQELVKTMEQVARPSAAFALWRDTGALAELVPVLASVDDAALAALDALPRATLRRPERTLMRLAALFLDAGAERSRAALDALRFPKREASWVAGLVERWNELGGEAARVVSAASHGAADDANLRRLLGRIGRLHAGAFLRIAAARWTAGAEAAVPAGGAAAVRAVHRRMRGMLYRDPLDVADLAIGGAELRGSGIPAGPIYAKILAALLEAVLAEPSLNTPERLLGELPRITAELGGPPLAIPSPTEH